MNLDLHYHVMNLVSTDPSIKSDREHVQDDAIRAIDCISDRYKPFMSHQTRYQYQNVAISQLELYMKELCIRSHETVQNKRLNICVLELWRYELSKFVAKFFDCEYCS